MIGCILLDRTKLKPFVIIPNKRVEKSLLLEGYNENNVIIYSQENSELFTIGPKKSLIWTFKKKIVTGYNREVILLLVGCSAHSSEILLQLCN